jgi:hypothetical protein
VSLAASKLYTRAVLWPAILACSSSGTPARISGYEFLHAGGERSFASIKIPGSCPRRFGRGIRLLARGRMELAGGIATLRRVVPLQWQVRTLHGPAREARRTHMRGQRLHDGGMRRRRNERPQRRLVLPYGECPEPLGCEPCQQTIAEGHIEIAGDTFEAGRMLVFQQNGVVTVSAIEAARLVLLGGGPLDEPRHLWWNFVSSSAQPIEQAKADSREGRFAMVPGETDFIPLPDEPQRPHMPR